LAPAIAIGVNESFGENPLFAEVAELVAEVFRLG